VADVTDLASVRLERTGWRAPLGPLPWHVTIDEPCSLSIDGPERGVARALLARIPELRITPLEEAAMCCGGPGSYATGQPEHSDAILARKFEHVVATGADVLVTENVSCLVQLARGSPAACSTGAGHAPDGGAGRRHPGRLDWLRARSPQICAAAAQTCPRWM